MKELTSQQVHQYLNAIHDQTGAIKSEVFEIWSASLGTSFDERLEQLYLAIEKSLDPLATLKRRVYQAVGLSSSVFVANTLPPRIAARISSHPLLADSIVNAATLPVVVAYLRLTELSFLALYAELSVFNQEFNKRPEIQEAFSTLFEVMEAIHSAFSVIINGPSMPQVLGSLTISSSTEDMLKNRVATFL